MICPKCGAENPESAEFCTLCLEKLVPVARAVEAGGSGHRQGGIYTSPGEWGADVVSGVETMRPVAKERIKRFRLRLAVYLTLVSALIAWFVLSLTVWGNPQPGKRAAQIMDALNEGEEELFISLFLSGDAEGASRLFRETTDYLGGRGSYRDLGLRVEVEDNYTARVFLEKGTIHFATGEVREIESADGLVIRLENRGGKWLASVGGTVLVP